MLTFPQMDVASYWWRVRLDEDLELGGEVEKSFNPEYWKETP